LIRFSAYDLGLRNNFFSVSLPYSIFIAASLLIVWLIAYWTKRVAQKRWWRNPHFHYMFIIVSVAQEIAYRGYLMHVLLNAFYWPAAILINSILFFLLHLIYTQDKMILTTTLVGGVALAIMYYFYTNLVWISIAHIFLNFFCILFRFFKPGDFFRLKED
jgi:membrane protease YdiL (CAAX protease family)